MVLCGNEYPFIWYFVKSVKHQVKAAPYSYLKFWIFYATFGLAKFTTNTLKTRQSDYFEDTHNVLNYLCVKNIIQC